ncbi:merR regulatory family protein [Clostridioides difficile CD133]|nr:MerR family transcriptional regulator [Clostridioides difficile]EQF13284.1 merR regulatory family protein [Clostridioides difficile CD133]
MFKIGEVSKLTQISIRMLRYYDELGILKPAKTDKYTGHRLYSVEQISILQRIVLLRDSKFSVAE